MNYEAAANQLIQKFLQEHDLAPRDLLKLRLKWQMHPRLSTEIRYHSRAQGSQEFIFAGYPVEELIQIPENELRLVLISSEILCAD